MEENFNRLDYYNLIKKYNNDISIYNIGNVDKFIYDNIPNRLYRYRPCTDYTIDAFKNDDLYFTPPIMFNDPFDTYVYYDTHELFDYLVEIINENNIKFNYIHIEALKKLFNEHIESLNGYNFSYCDTNNIINKLITMVIAMSNHYARTKYKSVCFSEELLSPIMWSHYANQHKGFLLGYETKNIAPYKNLETKVTCPIFPVMYTNSRCDATELGKMLLTDILNVFLKLNLKFHYMDGFLTSKLVMMKSKEWEYEKEWRLLYDNIHDNDTFYVIKKSAVELFLGAKVTEDDKNKLIEIAKNKNMKISQMFINYNSFDYKMSFEEII